MTQPASDPRSLPVQLPAPGSIQKHSTETLSTSLSVEVLWEELTRALSDSRDAILWPTNVAQVRTLTGALGEGAVLLETPLASDKKLYYRIVRFSPPHLIQYASLQGHHLAGGATIALEQAEGQTTLRWRIEYSGAPAHLEGLERFCTAFFASMAQQLRRLEAERAAR